MSDDLKNFYSRNGKADRFWDEATPVDLWRLQKKTDFDKNTMLFQPHPGSDERTPDVRVVERDGRQVVLGCRCDEGDYRGISTFDRKVTWFGSKTAKHFMLPANTAIPPGLAVTKDHKTPHGAYHYTIAPKDDMPLDLFLQHLRSLALAAQLTH
jgi:hypothetical protein